MDLKEGKEELIHKLLNESLTKWRPLQASLELTNRCNERCTHCYLESYEDDQNRILNLDQWKHILSELRRAGSLYLILMGGEAMLNPHFWEISKDAVEKGFSLSMITNGLKINSLEVAKKMSDIGFSYVTISLYSLNPEIHDRMTKVKGSHAKTMKAIEFLQQAGVPMGINCLLTINNIEGFFDVADWCLERGIEIKGDPGVTPKLNGDPAPTYLRATKKQLKWYFEALSKKWPEGTPKPLKTDANDYICNAGKGKCAVNAYGELLTCIEIRESLGSLIEKPFEELWLGPVAQKWRSLKMGQLQNLPDGKASSFCDHCPGMALHEINNPLKISTFFKDMAEIKEDTFQKFGGNNVK